MKTHPAFVSIFTRLQKAASDFDIRVEFEGNEGFSGWLIFPNGYRSPFLKGNFSVNGAASYEIAEDKNLTSRFLRQNGIRVPDGSIFFRPSYQSLFAEQPSDDIEKACIYADSLGFPVFIKPNNLSQGRFVCKVNTAEELRKIATDIFQVTNSFVVERPCPGNDYRLLLFGNELWSGYQRKAPCLVGDGKRSVKDLLLEIDAVFLKKGGSSLRAPFSNPDILAHLKKLGITLDCVLSDGVSVGLLDNNNISSGGVVVDKTSQVHESFLLIAQKVMNVLGLNLAGIDFLAEDITRDAQSQQWCVLEVNGRPAIKAYGPDGLLDENKTVESYKKILRFLLENNKCKEQKGFNV